MARANKHLHSSDKTSHSLATERASAKRLIAWSIFVSIILAYSVVPYSTVLAASYTLAEPNYAILEAKSADEKGSLRVNVTLIIKTAADGSNFGGLKIQEFAPGSPLLSTAVDVGDEIIAVNGYVFPTAQKLIDFIKTGYPGNVVRVDYDDVSAGVTRNVNVTLVPDNTDMAAVPSAPESVRHEVPLEHTTGTNPYSFPTEPETSSDNSSWWKAGAVIVGGTIFCIFAGCFDGDDDAANSETGIGSTEYYRPDPDPSADSDDGDRPDTSVGCAWGDRAYDTCR